MKTSFLYLKIWIIHILIYYSTFGFIIQSLTFWYKQWSINSDFIKQILLSPLIGAIGFYDGIPAYFIFAFFLFLIFNLFFKINALKSYIIATLIIYIGLKLLFYLYDEKSFTTHIISNREKNPLQINLLFLIVPSLALSSFIINKIIPRKKIFN